MPREFSLYRGAVPQAPQRHQASMPDIAPAPMRGAQLDRAIGSAERVALQYSDLHDLGVQQKEELALKDLEARRDADFNSRMNLKWGEEGSFYNEDGTRNENAEAEFVAKWQAENDKIPRNYWLGKNRMQGEARQGEVRMKIANGLSSELQEQELRNVRAVWQDNYEAEMARGNHGTARSMIDEAVQRGLLRPSQGELMKVRLSKAAAKKAGLSEDALSSFDDGIEEGSGDDLKEAPSSEESAVPRIDPPEVGEKRPLTLQAVGGEADAPQAGDDSMTLSLTLPKKRETISRLLNAPQGEEQDYGGSDPFVKAGFLSMNDDDFSAVVRNCHATEFAPSIRTDGITGATSLALSQTEPEAVQAAAFTEEGGGTLTKDRYRQFCYAKASSIVTDEGLKGLSDAEMKKYIVSSVKVIGGEQDWFAEEQSPELSYQAFLEDVADRVVSTRNDDIDSATDRVFKGEAGLGGIEQLLSDVPNADFAALYRDDSGVADSEDSLLAKRRIEVAEKILPVYRTYRKQFAAETGAGLRDDPAHDLTSFSNNIEAFREWYYKKGGVYERKVEEYIKSAKMYCRQAGVDAVCEYRRKGGTNWAEEQMLMRQAIDKAKGELSSHAAHWQRWRENREANLQFTAQKYRREAEAVMPELTKLQASRAFAALDQKEREKRDKEREEWEAEEAKAARKKAWRAGKEAAFAAVHPFAKKGTHVIKFQKDGGKDPVVTVTPEQYKQMLIDTKADKGQGIVCRFGNSSRRIVVKPGNVKGMRFNGAALFAIYGQHLSKEQLKSRVNLHKETITFEAF